MVEPGRELPGWGESDSDFFLRYADVLIPRRAEQLALLPALAPFAAGEEFVVVDLACGAGELSKLFLERFPRCRALALDGSPAMLAAAAETLAAFAGRFELRRFDLFETAWLEALPDGLGCVVSSMALHHLPGQAKRDLYAALASKLAPGGALLLQDIVEPASEAALRQYALRWDAWVHQRSLAVTGGLAVYQRFREDWNHFATPDPTDRPSPLTDQLAWLIEAGLTRADCFDLFAGFAVFGAVKPA